jgi:hypothetical protein
MRRFSRVLRLPATDKRRFDLRRVVSRPDWGAAGRNLRVVHTCTTDVGDSGILYDHAIPK